MTVASIRAWLEEIEHREAHLRCSNPVYQRFDRCARQLTVADIVRSQDAWAIAALESRLRRARHPTGFGRLDRVWSRAELGELIVAATNRGRQLAGGLGRPKGPRFDPRRIPDERLDWLIQRHQDLAVVDQLRAERARRQAESTPSADRGIDRPRPTQAGGAAA